MLFMTLIPAISFNRSNYVIKPFVYFLVFGESAACDFRHTTLLILLQNHKLFLLLFNQANYCAFLILKEIYIFGVSAVMFACIASIRMLTPLTNLSRHCTSPTTNPCSANLLFLYKQVCDSVIHFSFDRVESTTSILQERFFLKLKPVVYIYSRHVRTGMT